MAQLLSGTVAVIIGAARGIGRETARQLHNLGASVTICYNAHAAEATALADELGERAQAIQADITDDQSVQALFTKVRNTHGAVTVLVYCASSQPNPIPFIRSSWTAYQAMVETNLKGAYLCARESTKDMIQKKNGSIIFLSTIYTHGTPPASLGHYISAKSALAGFARTLAMELGAHAIRVNCVSPGFTDTDMTSHLPDVLKESIAKSTPLKKNATPSDVASVITFLATAGASHITGADIPISGGATMW